MNSRMKNVCKWLHSFHLKKLYMVAAILFFLLKSWVFSLCWRGDWVREKTTIWFDPAGLLVVNFFLTKYFLARLVKYINPYLLKKVLQLAPFNIHTEPFFQQFSGIFSIANLFGSIFSYLCLDKYVHIV